MRNRRRLGVACLATVGIGYSAQVEFYRREAHAKSRRASFSPNGGDEVLQNGLQTGDVVLFHRRWYRYHLPEALCIYLYQALHRTAFDHCGVVICDKYGAPHVFESTFFGGCKLRAFEPRILHSQSQQILLIPLLPRADLATPELHAHVVACLRGAGVLHSPYHILFSSLLPSPAARPHVLADMYAKMGITTSPRALSNRLIVDRAVQLASSSSPALRVQLSPQDVLVRTY